MTNSREFLSVAVKQCQNLTVIHVSKEEIEAEKAKLNELYQGITAVSRTLEVYVHVLGKYKMDVKDLAKAALMRNHTFKDMQITSDNETEVDEDGQLMDDK